MNDKQIKGDRLGWRTYAHGHPAGECDVRQKKCPSERHLIAPAYSGQQHLWDFVKCFIDTRTRKKLAKISIRSVAELTNKCSS